MSPTIFSIIAAGLQKPRPAREVGKNSDLHADMRASLSAIPLLGDKLNVVTFLG